MDRRPSGSSVLPLWPRRGNAGCGAKQSQRSLPGSWGGDDEGHLCDSWGQGPRGRRGKAAGSWSSVETPRPGGPYLQSPLARAHRGTPGARR